MYAINAPYTAIKIKNRPGTLASAGDGFVVSLGSVGSSSASFDGVGGCEWIGVGCEEPLFCDTRVETLNVELSVGTIVSGVLVGSPKIPDQHIRKGIKIIHLRVKASFKSNPFIHNSWFGAIVRDLCQ